MRADPPTPPPHDPSSRARPFFRTVLFSFLPFPFVADSDRIHRGGTWPAFFPSFFSLFLLLSRPPPHTGHRCLRRRQSSDVFTPRSFSAPATWPLPRVCFRPAARAYAPARAPGRRAASRFARACPAAVGRVPAAHSSCDLFPRRRGGLRPPLSFPLHPPALQRLGARTSSRCEILNSWRPLLSLFARPPRVAAPLADVGGDRAPVADARAPLPTPPASFHSRRCFASLRISASQQRPAAATAAALAAASRARRHCGSSAVRTSPRLLAGPPLRRRELRRTPSRPKARPSSVQSSGGPPSFLCTSCAPCSRALPQTSS